MTVDLPGQYASSNKYFCTQKCNLKPRKLARIWPTLNIWNVKCGWKWNKPRSVSFIYGYHFLLIFDVIHVPVVALCCPYVPSNKTFTAWERKYFYYGLSSLLQYYHTSYHSSNYWKLCDVFGLGGRVGQILKSPKNTKTYMHSFWPELCTTRLHHSRKALNHSQSGENKQHL